MIPIFEETAEGRLGYSFEEFKRAFLDICEQHRSEGRALAFAFILYDFTQPEVGKMLRDRDYWRALHEISGHYLTVFSFHVQEPREAYDREWRLMVGVGPVNDPGMKTQLILKSYFELEERLELPAVLFFQTDEAGIAGYYLVRLSVRGVEEAFNEIRDLLSIAAEAARNRAQAPDTTPHDIMKAVERSLARRSIRGNLQRGLKVLKEIKDAVGLLSLLG